MGSPLPPSHLPTVPPPPRLLLCAAAALAADIAAASAEEEQGEDRPPESVPPLALPIVPRANEDTGEDLTGVKGTVKVDSDLEFHAKDREHQEQIADWMERRALSMPTVLVTHQVNITALTGYFPASGELVFVRKDPSGALAVIGTIDTL